MPNCVLSLPRRFDYSHVLLKMSNLLLGALIVVLCEDLKLVV